MATVAEDHGLGGAGRSVTQAGRRNICPLLQRAASQRVRPGRSPAGRLQGDEPDAEQALRPAGREHEPELGAAATGSARLR